jgi:hypothetical protein
VPLGGVGMSSVHLSASMRLGGFLSCWSECPCSDNRGTLVETELELAMASIELQARITTSQRTSCTLVTGIRRSLEGATRRMHPEAIF